MRTSERIDFQALNDAALPHFLFLLRQWLPDGRLEGSEWVALNPGRPDRRLGSFKINIQTGVWADFATNDRGGDVISLLAYIERVFQLDAARLLHAILWGAR